MITIEDAERIVGDPALAWVGRCYEVACAIKEVVGGRPTYGHWLGNVQGGGPFAYARELGFARHGWLTMPDGTIVDPTRWVFDGCAPYIYHGPAHGLYDMGGSRLVQAMTGDAPSDPGKPIDFRVGEFGRQVIEATLGHQVRGFDDARWLAHVPPHLLGEAAADIYAALRAVGLGAAIPWDFQRYVDDAPVQR